MSVLGMHRCGTSLAVRLLSTLGIYLGPEEETLAPEPGNPRSFGEQRPIMDVNDAILETLGGTWWRPPEMPLGWERRPELAQLRTRADAVLSAQFDVSERWGWKDPRTSLTLPFWREIVPDARYVVCLRSPTEVASSLLRREPQRHTWESAIALWLRYSGEAIRNTAGADRLILFYEDYFEDRDLQLRRLAGFVGRNLDEVSTTVRGQLEAMVEADLRHRPDCPLEVAEADGVSLEARAFFLTARAKHIASSVSGTNGAGPVEPVPSKLSEAIEAFLPRLADGAVERETADRREEALVALREDRDAVRAAERERSIALDRALEELEAARLETREWEREATKLQTRLEWLERSPSWRLTRPLRAAKRRLAEMRRRLPGKAA